MPSPAGGAQWSQAGVTFTNLDQPLFEGAGVTKRGLVQYLDDVHDRILPSCATVPSR